MQQMRRIDILLTDDEVLTYDRLRQEAERVNKDLQTLVKEILAYAVRRGRS